MWPAVIELNEIRRSGAGRAGRAVVDGGGSSTDWNSVTCCGAPVFLDHEVLPRQARHRIAVLVEHDDVDGDEIDAGAEARRRLLRRNECAERERKTRQDVTSGPKL